jgi:hypothetical protein
VFKVIGSQFFSKSVFTKRHKVDNKIPPQSEYRE